MWQQNVVDINKETILPLEKNAKSLELETGWLEQSMQSRKSSPPALKDDINSCERKNISNLPPVPDLSQQHSQYSQFVARHNLSPAERLILTLALIPVVKPQWLDMLLANQEQGNVHVTELGLLERNGNLYATGATAAFISGGNDLTNRFQVLSLLQNSSALQKVLYIESDTQTSVNTSLLTMPLSLKPEYMQAFTTGEPFRPELSSTFPASPIETLMTWDDLILPDATKKQILEIKDWLQHGATLRNHWRIGKRLRPGYRALFYGPPGTGKTLTASVLGKALDMDVYRIDESMVTSKYIGETEKNLEQVFSLAEDRNWVLFFDEADALFGKRLNTSSSNDQFANQNVAYLLQRIESFNGLVILASNYKDNIDGAFFRRFESIVYFPPPGTEQRLSIWQSGFCEKSQLGGNVSLQQLAEQHTLSGAEIINVIRHVSVKLLSENRTEVLPKDIQEGILRVTEHQSTLRW